MTSDHRITPSLITDVLDVLHRHGYARGDDLHAARAAGLIGDLARIWDGTHDHPAGAHLITVPSSCLPSPDLAVRPPRTGSCSPAATSGPSWPRWTSPPVTSATALRGAQSALAGPAPRARSVSGTRGPTTGWLAGWSGPPKPLKAARASQSEPDPPREPTADKEAGQ
jgi:hypothetical protein